MKLKAHYLVLFFGLLLSISAYGQVDRRIGSNQYKRAPKNKDAKSTDFVEQTVNYYTKELKLDDFQQAAVRNIIKEQKDPINELMAAKDITNDERRDRGKAINDIIDAKMKPLLSEDQLKKYNEMQEKRKF